MRGDLGVGQVGREDALHGLQRARGGDSRGHHAGGRDDIPPHDVLTAGFRQPFSLAGVSKKNSLGRAHGFDDPTQGTLFFDVKRILEAHRPRAFLLENVKNLRSHDRGRTFRVITDSLREAGYVFSDRIIDAARVVQQHRERIFVVGFHRDWLRAGKTDLDWDPFWANVDDALLQEAEAQRRRYQLGSDDTWPRVGAVLQPEGEVDPRFALSDKLWKYLRDYREKHEKKGNGFGYGLVTPELGYTRTISARYHKDGSEALVAREPGENPRRLTPLECLRLQGFPADLGRWRVGESQPVSDTRRIVVRELGRGARCGHRVRDVELHMRAALLDRVSAAAEAAGGRSRWSSRPLRPSSRRWLR